jgi:DNA polymerase
MSRIFINYRRQDSEGYVGRLYDHLTQFFERGDIFMDIEAIKPGQDFVETLENAVTQCDVLLAVIGPHWLESADANGTRRLDLWNDFVRIELATALKYNKMVIPVLVGRAQMPNPELLPEDIKLVARRNAFEISHNRFTGDVERLAKSLKELVPVNTAFKEQRPDNAAAKKKALALRALREELVKSTNSPLYQVRMANGYIPVLGDGNPDANLIFVGEAPGKAEAELGRPFVGPSGDILAEMLREINLRREDVYVTNLILDRPPEKRDPLPAEIAFYAPFLDRILDIIQPAVICTLGRFAMQYILKKLDLPEKSMSITQNHGKLLKTQLPYGEIHVVPLFHPAVVLYSATQKETLRQDFLKLKMYV